MPVFWKNTISSRNRDLKQKTLQVRWFRSMHSKMLCVLRKEQKYTCNKSLGLMSLLKKKTLLQTSAYTKYLRFAIYKIFLLPSIDSLTYKMCTSINNWLNLHSPIQPYWQLEEQSYLCKLSWTQEVCGLHSNWVFAFPALSFLVHFKLSSWAQKLR